MIVGMVVLDTHKTLATSECVLFSSTMAVITRSLFDCSTSGSYHVQAFYLPNWSTSQTNNKLQHSSNVAKEKVVAQVNNVYRYNSG